MQDESKTGCRGPFLAILALVALIASMLMSVGAEFELARLLFVLGLMALLWARRQA